MTLRGSTVSNLSTSVFNQASSLLSGADARKTTDTAANLVSWLTGQITISNPPTGMTFITNTTARAGDYSATANWEDQKLLRVESNGLNLTDLHFRDVTVNYAGGTGENVVNGFIGNSHSNTTDAWLGNLTGNAFTNLTVDFAGFNDATWLAGGGIVGVRATGEYAASASASMDDIEGNLFKDITIITRAVGLGGSAYIEGGGIIGVDAVSSPDAVPGHARIAELSSNFFTGIQIRSDDIILGGGLVGVNNNSQVNDANTTYARLGIVSGNVFGNGVAGDITVTSNFSLRGGGVIGVSGLSNAAVQLDWLTGNVFAGIDVTSTTSYIKGGGIVGLQSNDNINDKYAPFTASPVHSYLNVADGNLFLNTNVTAGTYLDGGGIIGLRANTGSASLNGLTNNIFKGLTVTSGEYLHGGGVVGVSSATAGNIVNAQSNWFDEIGVTVQGELEGGGVIGVNAGVLNAGNESVIGFVMDNTFKELDINVVNGIEGGGVIGGHTATGPISPITGSVGIQRNRFTGVRVDSTGDLAGGGVIGFDADAGTAIITSVAGNLFDDVHVNPNVTGGNISGGGVLGVNSSGAGIDDAALFESLSENSFTNLTVSGNAISGGGVIGANAEHGHAGIASLDGNRFSDLTVNTAQQIQGGGVVGVYSGGTSGNNIAYIREITRNTFSGLNVTAGTYIDGGGIVGATGETHSSAPGQIMGIGLIDSSVFTGNTVTAQNGQIMGGAVYSYGSFNTLTIRDSEFSGNRFNSTSSGIARVYGTVAVDTGLSGPDNTTTPNSVILTATAGKSTIFLDNQITDTATRANSLYFGAIRNPGASGTPDDPESDAQLTIDPQAGGTVALYDPILVNQTDDPENPAAGVGSRTFAMTVQGSGKFLWGGQNAFYVSAYSAGTNSVDNTVTFNSGSMTTLLSGMTLFAENHNFTLNPGGQINVMGGDAALTGLGELGNELTVNQANLNGNLHFNLNAPTVVLNDDSTALLKIHSPNATDIGGATVSLGNFGSASDATLAPGDKFYLIDTDSNNLLANDPANNMAYARQGLTRGYNFIIDKEGASGNAADEKQLVARLLRGVVPAKEARILTEGRSASLALLGQTADWLADHSYQQADLALRRGEKHAAFGGVDGSRIRADTGSHVNLHGNMMLAGLASRSDSSDSSFLFGGYFEGGYANYNIHGKFGHPDSPNMKGKGNLRFYGFGLMARQRWDSGFRLEASARAGRLENRFHSHDLTDPTTGAMAKYNLHTAYFGAHVGAGYEHELDEHSRLDFVARYYWARQNGKSVTLGNGERVKFQGDDSSRVRVGSRYTYVKDETHSYYVGLAYEYEFDHRTRASSYGNDFSVPTLKGSSGVGEIGMIVYPRGNERFSAEFGLQGYTGKREGVSGGIRVGWKF
jgi:hypothetical protein